MQTRARFLILSGPSHLKVSSCRLLVLLWLCALLLLPLTACITPTTTSSVTPTVTSSTKTTPTTSEETSNTSAPTTPTVPTETFVLEPLEALDKVTYDKVTTKNRNMTVIKSFDLNSDGQKEPITLTAEGRKTGIVDENFTVYVNYTLKVGGSMLDSRTMTELSHDISDWAFEPQFNICDIDASDRYREITVSYAGLDMDAGTTFYRYDGQNLQSLGTISGQYGKIMNRRTNESYMGVIRIAGDNLVHTTSFGNLAIMQFFADEYSLNQAGLLARIEKDLYPINQQHTVGVTFTLRKSRTDPGDGITIKKGEKVTLKDCDNKQWVSVVNARGEIGWFEVVNYQTVKGTDFDVKTLFPDLIVGG